jgi:hypothetical protein
MFGKESNAVEALKITIRTHTCKMSHAECFVFEIFYHYFYLIFAFKNFNTGSIGTHELQCINAFCKTHANILYIFGQQMNRYARMKRPCFSRILWDMHALFIYFRSITTGGLNFAYFQEHLWVGNGIQMQVWVQVLFLKWKFLIHISYDLKNSWSMNHCSRTLTVSTSKKNLH